MPTYRNLDKTPRIFFLPGDQIFPWLIIFGVCYVLLKKVFGLSWIWVGSVTVWGIVTWWLLTWKGMHYFFGRLVPTPNWVRTIVLYEPVLNRHSPAQKRSSRMKDKD